ncbi:hypothetical protein Leryth_002137 [Lithospermum erythrorhizon]|nr:hypothetical protein Leryth_002137 [Lithospermum erythrorhizon]
MNSIVEEPMLTRIDRLDNIIKKLEEIRRLTHGKHSPRSSYESTHSRSTSDGQGALSSSSVDFSPRSMEKHCRPMDDVIVETERKGTLLERLMYVEDRVLKMCEEMEEELKDRRRRDYEVSTNIEKKSRKKGLKQLVKKCMPHKGTKTKEEMVA